MQVDQADITTPRLTSIADYSTQGIQILVSNRLLDPAQVLVGSTRLFVLDIEKLVLLLHEVPATV